MRPFNAQHPVRANFGAPRTISAERFDRDDRGDPGDYSFHNGVDVSAKPGAEVFPVVSGIASLRHADEVLIDVPGGLRNFQYCDDRTAPVVDALAILNQQCKPQNPQAISGTVSIAADAADSPPRAVPGAWDGFPVTPAVVRSTFVDAEGRAVVPLRTVADFQRFEPPQRDFWSVYAAGTFQNFPAFDHHYYWRYPGRDLVKLTRRPLDTTRLRNGAFRLRVIASDICGNRGTLTERIRIANA